jgi:hypothetical protein
MQTPCTRMHSHDLNDPMMPYCFPPIPNIRPRDYTTRACAIITLSQIYICIHKHSHLPQTFSKRLNNYSMCHHTHTHTHIHAPTYMPPQSHVFLSKKYIKYLTKKFLQKKGMRDFMRPVAKGFHDYEVCLVLKRTARASSHS